MIGHNIAGHGIAAPGVETRPRLHVGVTGRQHRGKSRGLFFAPSPFTRLLKMPMAAHNLQCSLAVNLLLHPPQGLFYRLAFFKLNLGQNSFTSSPATYEHPRPSWPPFLSGQEQEVTPRRDFVNAERKRKK